ncbi:MAG TPA: hypothetical protein VMW35_09555 [Myxococcota bacterium]|nr:hypothetical protein [Myxococcota bacterium]
MNLKGVGNIIGLIVGLAIVSVIAAKPQFLATTFTGTTGLINAATAPVRGK